MRFLSAEESSEWCRSRGLPVLRKGETIRTKAAAYEFKIPEDTGRRIALCRYLWETARTQGSMMCIWVTDWSVWPSCEHMPLFARLRGALGEHRELIDIPGHLVEPDEGDDGLSVFILCCLFLCDFNLYSESGVVMRRSHDEWGTIASLHEPLDISQGAITSFGLKRV